MSQDNNKPLYCGSAKKVGENGMQVTICLTELWEHLKDPASEPARWTYEYTDRDGNKVTKKYFKLAIWPMKEENQNEKKTHSVKLDTWKPEKKEQPAPAETDENGDPLPF